MEKLNQDYDAIMNLWFYDLQNMLDSYSRIIEKRNEEDQNRAKQEGYDQKNMNPKSMMDSAKGMMPKMPNISFPKI